MLDRLLHHGTEVRRERERAARRRRDAGLRAPLPRVGRRLDRLPPRDGGVAGLPAEPRGDHQGARGGHLLHREPRAPGGRRRRARPPAGGPVPARRRGDVVELPARSCLVAAGTTPNITYEKEWPGTFPMDERRRFFLPHRAVARRAGGWTLEPAAADDEGAFFTGYARDGKFITFFGDNHPAFNGNVVKAMASAKKGYGPITDVLGGRPERRAEAPIAEWEAFRGRIEDDLTARGRRRQPPDPDDRRGRRAGAGRGRELPAGTVLPASEPRGARAPRRGLAAPDRAARPDGRLGGRGEGPPLDDRPRARRLLALCSVLKPGEPVARDGPDGHRHRAARATGRSSSAAAASATPSSSRSARRPASSATGSSTSPGYKKARRLLQARGDRGGGRRPRPSVDRGEAIPARRPTDREFVGNIVEAMVAYATGQARRRRRSPSRRPSGSSSSARTA